MSNSPENESVNADRRRFVAAALTGAAGGVAAMNVPSDGRADDRERPIATRAGIYPGQSAPPADSGYAPGNVATGSRILFVSGQGPQNLEADIETQIRQTFDRIGAVLKDAGAGFEHVVILRAYFVHLARDLPILRKVRRDYLPTPPPASTAVGVTELAIPGLEIEIEAVAVY